MTTAKGKVQSTERNERLVEPAPEGATSAQVNATGNATSGDPQVDTTGIPTEPVDPATLDRSQKK